jgi:iron complex outermembrane receptor protein
VKASEVSIGASFTLQHQQSDNTHIITKLLTKRVQHKGTQASLFDSSEDFMSMVEVTPEQERRINSLSLQFKTQFKDSRWHIVYGGRIDDYSDQGTQSTPKLGLIFRPSVNSAYKLLYGQAFRAPTATEMMNSSVHAETIDTYEMVWMKEYANRKSTLTLFSSHWENGINSTRNFNEVSSFNFENIDKSSSHGVEFEYNAHWDLWTINGSAAYIRSQNDIINATYDAYPRYSLSLDVGYYSPESQTTYTVQNTTYFQFSETPATETTPVPDKLATFWQIDIGFKKAVTPQLTGYGKIKNIFDRDNKLPSLWLAEGGYQAQEIALVLGFEYDF